MRSIGRRPEETPFEIGRGNHRCGGRKEPSGRDTPTREITEDRAFAGARDGMTGTGAEVLQYPVGVGGTRTLVDEVKAKHGQEIAAGTNLRRLLERPEEGLDLGRPPTLLHAGIIVLRVGCGLARLQVRLVERIRQPGRVLARLQGLGALLIDPRLFLEPMHPALGAAQDLRSLLRVGMVTSQMVLAGG